MDNTTSSTANPPAATPTTPFPAAGSATAPASASTAKPADAAAPIVDRLIQRAASSAHDAVDNVAAKVSSLTDGLQSGVDKVGDTRDEWIASAREAIRQHPLAAIAGALVVGAALLTLRSSRDR